MILTTKMVRNGCFGIYRSKNAKKNISDSFSGQNQILTPHPNRNYTPITRVKWKQNLILTTKMVKNGCLGIYRSKNDDKKTFLTVLVVKLEF